MEKICNIEKGKSSYKVGRFENNKISLFVMRLMTAVKKYKKSLLVLCFIFGYIVFWWWFFNEKNIAIKESKVSENQNIIENVVINNQKSEIKKDDKKEFTNKDLGNFWLEIDTDKVKIKAPIVNGVTPDKLAQGIGHHKTTAMPSRERGNVVLSGHRWKFGKNPAYTVFEDIGKLKKDDEVILHYRDEDFKYKIIEKQIVNNKAIKILEQTDESMLTFYTCTPKYTAFRRLVYRAKLIE